MEDVLKKHLSDYTEGIKTNLENNTLNAYEKLMLVLRSILSNNQGPEHLTKHVEDNKNARLHQMMDQEIFQ